MNELRRLLAGEIDGPLDLAAAQLAGIEIPDFDPAPVIAQLDSLAQQLDAACPRGASGKQFVAAANRLFFETLGYTGNQADYYDPRNSFLHQVLDRRSGMPITLSVIYMEVARRAGRAVHGIGLPGHFIVQYSDADWSAFIDPFHGGRLLTRRDCEQLVRERTGLEIGRQEQWFAPSHPRDIVLRMARNLQGMYLRLREFDKALSVAELLAAQGHGQMPRRGADLRPRNPLWN